MSWKLKIRDSIFRTTGLMIYQKKPFGQDPFQDIKRSFPNYPFNVFFDVGANIGQTVSDIVAFFPNAEIWCFEPVQKTFEVLKERTKGKNINYQKIALGSENIQTEIFVDEDNLWSDMTSIVNAKTTNPENLVSELITIEKLDDFCLENSIETIDYLKIDTEGYDYEVLKGGVKMLEEQLIAFVEVEVSMNPENTFHVDFVMVKEFMESHAYRLYGLYDQMHEWQTNTPILRRTNPLFVADKVFRNY